MGTVLEVKIPRLQRDGFALKEIEFKVEAGYLTALLGVNGAGKTTLLSAISGLLPLPEEAEVFIGGYSMRENEREAKECMGFVFEESPFDEGLSAQATGEMYGHYYRNWDEKCYAKLLERFEVPKKRSVYKLSKGMKMKFQLAFALSHGAEFLIMDEPAAAFDPVFREEFMEVLRETLAEENCGILLSSHLVSELETQADYTVLLHQGEQIVSCSTEELLDRFLLVRGRYELFSYMKSRILGTRLSEYTAEGLILNDGDPVRLALECVRPGIEDIMYYVKQGIIRKGTVTP
ncbi:MAG: ABC transporter ATP-binding protein [Lachnospiraceae bacterium]|nr:ABC transporter ATP-binding protein [Lachnospiraceae bacterium]